MRNLDYKLKTTRIQFYRNYQFQKKFYSNTQYFYQIYFVRKESYFPISREFHPRKRELSFGKIENAERILISQKIILFFEGEIPWKWENNFPF